MKSYVEDVKAAIGLASDIFTLDQLIELIVPKDHKLDKKEVLRIRWAANNYVSKNPKKFKKGRKIGRVVYWEKILSSDIPVNNIPPVKEHPFKIDATQIGESILTLIENLKKEKKELCDEVKQLVNEKKELENTIRILQERKSSRTLSLSELGI